MTTANGLRGLPDIWLDVTRLLSRVGRGVLTGIDRVEFAYLAELADSSALFLCRTTRGYLLLDRRGAAALVRMVDGREPPGSADWVSQLTLRGNRPRHRAEATLRKVAIARCARRGLPELLDRYGGAGVTFLNVGHANLSEATLSAFSARADSQLAIMIHDLIPLTHPDFVADGLPTAFAGRIDRVRRHASLIIANSGVTDADLAAHWKGAEAPAHRLVAPLGVGRLPPPARNPDPKHFVMLGTIEARKNHALMLDTWDALADELPPQDMPHLHIIGATGWKVDAVMERLRTHPFLNRYVFHHGPLSDEEVRNHLSLARALVYPSIAEGYGYPPLEAALAGVVPICSTLPVYRETLGDCAVYVDSPDAYHWKETIKQQLDGTAAMPDLNQLTVPTWQQHFEVVADALTARADLGQK